MCGCDLVVYLRAEERESRVSVETGHGFLPHLLLRLRRSEGGKGIVAFTHLPPSLPSPPPPLHHSPIIHSLVASVQSNLVYIFHDHIVPFLYTHLETDNPDREESKGYNWCVHVCEQGRKRKKERKLFSEKKSSWDLHP